MGFSNIEPGAGRMMVDAAGPATSARWRSGKGPFAQTVPEM
jgi:ribosomal protein L24E